MGKIIATYDLMPQDTDVPLDRVSADVANVLPEGVKLIETKIEPVAFGLKKVVVGLQIDDSIDSVGTDLENALRAIDGVEGVECTASALM